MGTSINSIPSESDITSFEKVIVSSIDPEGNQSSLSRIEKIVERALRSRHIRELYERANAIPACNKSGKWKVKFVKETYSKFRAECDYKERTIHIRENISDDYALSFFVFELTNAVQVNKKLALHEKALRGQIDCESYAKESERREYNGTLLHHKVMSAAIKEMNWSKALDIYRYVEKDFEVYWSRIKNSPHTDYHRERWRECWDWYRGKSKVAWLPMFFPPAKQFIRGP
ncbi:MAG: hypothetical protein AAF443_08360 [Chlamydiota bacterium]